MPWWWWWKRREFQGCRLKWTKAFSSLQASSSQPSIFNSTVQATPSILGSLTALVDASVTPGTLYIYRRKPLEARNTAQGRLWPIRRLLGPTVIVSATIIVTTNYHCRLNYHRVACASPTVIVALHIFPLRYFQGIPSCVRGGVSLSSKASSPSHPWVSFPPIHRHPPRVPYTVYPAVFSPNAGPVRYH